MKNGKRLKIAALVLLCAGLWCWRYFSFNAEIAEIYTPKRAYYAMNEAVDYAENIVNLHSYRDCSLTLLSARLIAAEDFCREFSLPEISEWDDAQRLAADGKLCMIEVEFYNGAEKTMAFDIMDAPLYGRDMALSMSPFVIEINPVLRASGGSVVELAPGASERILLPYVLSRAAFTDAEWQSVGEYPLFLFVTQFPEERVVRIAYS